MRKSLMLIAIMLASFVLAPGNALAEVSVGQGNADCAAWGVLRAGIQSTPLSLVQHDLLRVCGEKFTVLLHHLRPKSV